MGSITPNTESRSYDTFFASTKVKYGGEPVDSVYRKPRSWEWVKALSDKGSTQAGERVEFPVMLGSFAGSSDLAYGSLDTYTPQDVEISTIGWGSYFTKVGAVAISEQKMRANEGVSRKYNYVKGQLDQFIRGQDAELNTDIWAASQDALKILSLATAISTTTGSGSVLNLSRSTYSKWRQNYTNLASAAFTASGLNGFRTIHHALSQWATGGEPDTIFMDDTLHAIYERITDAKEITYMADGGKGKSPTLSLAMNFRGCEIIHEPVDYPESTSARFFNSSTWHFQSIQSDKPGDAKPPFNGMWWAYPIVQAGFLWCDSLIRNGICANFLAS